MAKSVITEATQLNTTLKIVETSQGDKWNLQRRSGSNLLPGQPLIRLDDDQLLPYLRQALLVPSLDKLSPHLWLIAAPDFAHISPLHHQAAKSRTVIVAEDPHLHLVWYSDRIFIKPLPPYILSDAFWTYIENVDEEIWRAAAGLVRSYSRLIKYEVDFRRAQSKELGLIPTDDGTDPITFERFARFIVPFSELKDEDVAIRFQFGELRLNRLNMMARFFLGKATFHHVNAQWANYLGRFLAPFITIFLILTTILNSMQVELAVMSLPTDSGSWLTFARASRWLSVIVLLIVAIVIIGLLILLLIMFFNDQYFSQFSLRAKQKGRNQTFGEITKLGVV